MNAIAIKRLWSPLSAHPDQLTFSSGVFLLGPGVLKIELDYKQVKIIWVQARFFFLEEINLLTRIK